MPCPLDLEPGTRTCSVTAFQLISRQILLGRPRWPYLIRAIILRGHLDEVSLYADHHFTKCFDAYAGIAYSDVAGGLVIAIPHGPGVPYYFNNNVAPSVGARFTFGLFSATAADRAQGLNEPQQAQLSFEQYLCEGAVPRAIIDGYLSAQNATPGP